MLKRALLSLVALPLLTPVCFAKTPTPPKNPELFVGTYDCSGFDPTYGHSYTGRMTVKLNLNTKNSYFIHVTYPKMASASDSGLGFAYDDSFVVMFTDPSYGLGVAIYKTDAYGNLNGGKFMYYRHPNRGMGDESCIKTSGKSIGENA